MGSSGNTFLVLLKRFSAYCLLGPTRARRQALLRSGCSLVCALLLFGSVAGAQVNIYMRSFDNARTGANLQETTLTPASVNSTQFGKLFTVSVDGEVYAQPLYVSKLSIAGGTHNVVYVATMNNSLYALDADTGAQLWTRNFGPGIVSEEVENDQNISWLSTIGILSTPVIDPTTNIMYLTHAQETHVNGSPVYQYFLEAVDITTGNQVLGSPVEITAKYTDADRTTPLVLNPQIQNQRSALALANGNVYFAFGSHEDIGAYHGWVLSYNEWTLGPKRRLCRHADRDRVWSRRRYLDGRLGARHR